MAAQFTLDFTQFDADAIDLDLPVEPPQDLDAAVRQVAPHVASPVDQVAGLGIERVLHKVLLGQRLVAVVALAHKGRLDVDFSNFADPAQLLGFENNHRGIGERFADRYDGIGLKRLVTQPIDHLGQGGLRRAVEIDQLYPLPHALPPAAHITAVQGLASQQHLSQLRQGIPFSAFQLSDQ